MDSPQNEDRNAHPLLNERTRVLELLLFSLLHGILAAALIFAGIRAVVDQSAGFGILPVSLEGLPAVLLGLVYIVSGAAIGFATWAMWRIFR